MYIRMYLCMCVCMCIYVCVYMCMYVCIFLLLFWSMHHYLCNTTCYYLHSFLYLCFYVLFMSYCSSCCSWSKSIDSTNSLYTFLWLVISSCLLSLNFIGLFIRRLSISLCPLVFMQLNRMRSIVWSSFPQMHVASYLSLNL